MADLHPPEGLRMVAYRAARDWATTHFHQQPDDRMIDAGLAAAVRHLERPDSPLCDCPRLENVPTNWQTKAAVDHHCGCRAVETAAIMLGAYSKTVHAAQCVHGIEMDEFYGPPVLPERRRPMAADAELLAQIELVGDIEEWIVDATCDPDCDAYRGPNGSACARCEALFIAAKLTDSGRLGKRFVVEDPVTGERERIVPL